MKKVFKRKTLALVATIVTVIAFYAYTQFAIKSQIKPTKVVVATQDIPPNTKITKDMVAYMTVPGDSIPPSEKIIKNSNDVIDYYTVPGYGIPKNSLIHGKKINKKEQRPDEGVLSLKANENTFTFNVDISTTHGNSIIPGQKIDIYTAFVYEDPNKESLGNDKKPFFGRLAKDVRVLTVRDNKGTDIYSEQQFTEKEGEEQTAKKQQLVPSVITVAVDVESLKYLTTAKMIGALMPVANGLSSPYLNMDELLEEQKLSKEDISTDENKYNEKITREFLEKISLDPKMYIPYFSEGKSDISFDELKEAYQNQTAVGE